MEATNRQAERERWGRIHIAGDRNPPIFLPDRRAAVLSAPLPVSGSRASRLRFMSDQRP